MNESSREDDKAAKLASNLGAFWSHRMGVESIHGLPEHVSFHINSLRVLLPHKSIEAPQKNVFSA